VLWMPVRIRDMEKDCGGEDIEYPDYGLRIEAAVINEIKNTSRFNQKRSTYFRTVTHDLS